MKAICISGKAQHGKDTVAGFLQEYLEQMECRVLITHYGDLVKYVCRVFFDWDGNKDEWGRSLLQRVGTDVVRERNADFWRDFVQDILRFFPDEWDYVIIPDCRFPNELMPAKMSGGWHLRVLRPDFDNGLTKEQQAHPSETALDNAEYACRLVNDAGLEELRSLTRRWVDCAVWKDACASDCTQEAAK